MRDQVWEVGDSNWESAEGNCCGGDFKVGWKPGVYKDDPAWTPNNSG